MATGDENVLFDIISKISKDYPDAKLNKDKSFEDFINDDVGNSAGKIGFLQKDYYYIYGGCQKGNNWAAVPWFGIFDKRINAIATSGQYVVYLRATNGDVYLTFNQGCDKNEEKKKTKGKDYYKEFASIVRKKIDSRGFSTGEIDLKAGKKPGRPRNYERATVFSRKYSFDSIPNEEILRSDLENMLKIYEEFVEKRDVIFAELSSSKFNMPEAMKNDSYFSRFIRSLLAKHFVILTGNSGTGKTRIAVDFAKSMNVNFPDGNNWVLIPVGADWTDNTPILGYYNPMGEGGKGEYVKTKILDLLIRAINNREYPFFLILDEMNLSHVERYFSDFLSLMESPGVEFEIKDFSKEKYTYPDNLFVVGTVNVDETTYMFSPKVLDRANVIEFKPDEDSVFNLFNEQSFSLNPSQIDDSEIRGFMHMARKIYEYDYKMNLSEVREVFRDIYKDLEPYDLEFSYRTVKEICRYCYAANELDGNSIDFDEIIDEQIVQKILPKIHGNKRSIGNLLSELAKKTSNYELSSTKISKMQTKLDSTQYVSFI